MPGDVLSWNRSSYCSDSACVETAGDGPTILLRNSTNPDVTLRFSRKEWELFVADLRAMGPTAEV